MKPQDYYGTLNVPHNATSADIKKAFRALAKRYHPDKNPNNSWAEEQFKRVQEAYGVLSDSQKRAKHDRDLRLYEASQRFRPTPSNNVRPSGSSSRRNDGFFSWLFSEAMPRRRTVTLSFEKAFRGGPVVIRVPENNPVRVTLPPGIPNGHKIRIRDIDGPPLQVIFKVPEHKTFRMRGNDLVVRGTVKVGAMKAILGGPISVPHPEGTRVPVEIPPGTQTGATLRVNGKGVRGGDMILKTRIVVPKNLTQEQRNILRRAARAAGLA